MKDIRCLEFHLSKEDISRSRKRRTVCRLEISDEEKEKINASLEFQMNIITNNYPSISKKKKSSGISRTWIDSETWETLNFAW